jgi:hypothetical protein
MCLILPTGELPGESAGGPVTPAGTSGTGHVIALVVVVADDVGPGETPGLALARGPADGGDEATTPGPLEAFGCGGLDPTVAPEPQPANAMNETKNPRSNPRRTMREFFHAPLKCSLTRTPRRDGSTHHPHEG